MEATVAPDSHRRAVLAAVALATAALAAALVFPNLYSDPNGLDPYVLRLAAVAAALCGLAYARPRLIAGRGALLSFATVAVSFSAWLYMPRFIFDRGARVGGPASNFWASLVWLAATAAGCLIARRLPANLRPTLRLRSFGVLGAMLALGGSALIVFGGLLLPATWFGREGLQLVALSPGGSADMLWLGPACVLQAAAQELQFRGLLLGALERVLPAHAANIGQSLLFGLTHLAFVYQGPLAPFVPLTALVGYLLGLLVQRTHSMWPAIIVHAVADIAITVAVIPGLYGY